MVYLCELCQVISPQEEDMMWLEKWEIEFAQGREILFHALDATNSAEANCSTLGSQL